MDNKKYLDLIVPEHRKPKFLKWLSCILEKINDIEHCAEMICICFDLDNAKGKQLDILGELVGTKRELTFQPSKNESSILQDDIYRTVIRAKIGINHWDGTIPSIYALWKNLFPDYKLYIKDNQDMSMEAIVMGNLTELEKELVHNGYIVPRPEGVKQNTATASEIAIPEKSLHIAGAVFRPIAETILPEINDNIDFHTDVVMLANSYNIGYTTLPEIKYEFDFYTNIMVLLKNCSIESTTLPELEY